MIKNYQEQPDNAFAVKVLRSWLRATNIPFQDSPSTDLAVQKADGSWQDVTVALAGTERQPRAYIVHANDIAHKKNPIALMTFHALTNTLGHGKPLPVDRGPDIAQNALDHDFFLGAARHRDFRRSPNLPAAKYKEYKDVMDSACRSFLSKNPKLCAFHGYEIDDLRTYAMIWVHIFVHKYEVIKPTQKDGTDNQRLCMKYLNNRFYQMFQMMERGKVLTAPPKEEVSALLYGQQMDDHMGELYVTPHEEDIEVHVSREDRSSTTENLRAKLSEMPHDQYVEHLTRIVAYPYQDVGTRRLANQRLKAHKADCPVCQKG
ncbi:hypothetical protein UFOVP75_126 [uncultured Caudovirales phage]|uniref:Uncharacterized protein n=1 Tax=uncultured Caudovirales phage TaxID=2100421 RepID=A0A6J5L217_9CAUD|nr:hypothetical protein UFOVP75_126 [uncultured Caudovirales phage]